METTSAITTTVDDARTPEAPGGDVAQAAPVRGRLPFAARVQGALIVVMLLGMVLIGQRANKDLYQIGLPILVIAAFLQIAFGNIPPRSGFATSMKLLVLTWAIVAAVFALGIILAPHLIDLGRQEQ